MTEMTKNTAEMNGRFYDAAHLSDSWMPWAQLRLAAKNTTAWERKFLQARIEKVRAALAKAEGR